MNDYDKIQDARGALSSAAACLRSTSTPGEAEVVDALEAIEEAQSALQSWIVGYQEAGPIDD